MAVGFGIDDSASASAMCTASLMHAPSAKHSGQAQFESKKWHCRLRRGFECNSLACAADRRVCYCASKEKKQLKKKVLVSDTCRLKSQFRDASEKAAGSKLDAGPQRDGAREKNKQAMQLAAAEIIDCYTGVAFVKDAVPWRFSVFQAFRLKID